MTGTPDSVVGGRSRPGGSVLDTGRLKLSALAAFLGANPRPAKMFLETGLPQPARRASREVRWGWDGASLKSASGFFVDPIGFEGQDANLYRYVGNSPGSLVDPFGLASKPACYCCCAQDLKISEPKAFDAGGYFGHKFDVAIEVGYPVSTKTKDCALKWEEYMNWFPSWYDKDCKSNKWCDLTDHMSGEFDWWNIARKKPSGGSETARFRDEPYIPIFKSFRHLEIKITVTSGQGCPCAFRSISVHLRQDLEGTYPSGPIVKQSFEIWRRQFEK